MNTPHVCSTPRLLSPYRPGGSAGSAALTAPADSYVASGASEAPRRLTARALLLAGCVLAPLLAGSAMAQTPVPPAVSTTCVAEWNYANPLQPEPPMANPDNAVWLQRSRQAFDALKAGQTDAFLQVVSPEGVWIRGLPATAADPDQLVHMTKPELARDLRCHRDFYRYTFGQHQNPRFTVSPDAGGNVRTILLD